MAVQGTKAHVGSSKALLWSAGLVAAPLIVGACSDNDASTLVASPRSSAAATASSAGEGADPPPAAGGGGSTTSSKGGSSSSRAGARDGAGGSSSAATSGASGAGGSGGTAATNAGTGSGGTAPRGGTSTSGGTPGGGSTASSGGAVAGGSAGLDPSSGSGGDGATGAGGAPQPGFMVAFTETASCATCHGDTGEGVATYGPDIRHPSRDLYLYMVRTGEPHQLALFRKPMEPFDTTLVSDADLDAIYDWLSAMPKPTTGAELFADYCSYCHGADGRGGDKTVAYASAYHSAPYRRSGQEFLDYVRAGHVVDDEGNSVPVSDRHAYMPPFPPEMLTDQEIQLIEAWVPKQ